MSAARIVITATGAVCSGGKNPAEILAGVRAGTSSIAPIQQWDVTGWPTKMAGEVANFNAREMVEDRKLHKLIRRTDLFGLYAAGRAIDGAGHRRVSRHFGRRKLAATFNDRTGVYVGSGSGNFENQYDYFPLLETANGSLPKFGQELCQYGEPDVAAALAAQQRARAYRHQIWPERQQRMHHQPQLQWFTGGDRRHGGIA